MVFREKVVLFSQAGALPGEGLESIITQAQALDMKQVHADIAAQQTAAADTRAPRQLCRVVTNRGKPRFPSVTSFPSRCRRHAVGTRSSLATSV